MVSSAVHRNDAVSLSALPRPIEVERVDGMSPTQFRPFLAAQRPVVLGGVGRGQPFAGWSCEHFAEHFPERRFSAWTWAAGPRNDAIDLMRNRKMEETTFRKFVGELRELGSSRSLYATVYLQDSLPELCRGPRPFAEYFRSTLLPPRVRAALDFDARPLMWLGPGGSITPLHFDMTDVFLCQVEGRKKVVLFSPEETPNLYLDDKQLREQYYFYSPVDVAAPDLEKFPRFARAQPWTAEIGPGDVLYMPFAWWHWVTSLDRSLSLSLCFVNAKKVLSSPQLLLEAARREPFARKLRARLRGRT